MAGNRRGRGIPGMGNERYVDAMREVRRSGAAGLHLDRRARRARTREARRRRAVEDEGE